MFYLKVFTIAFCIGVCATNVQAAYEIKRMAKDNLREMGLKEYNRSYKIIRNEVLFYNRLHTALFLAIMAGMILIG